MEKVELIDPVKDPRWDQFVEKHPFGWICHLSAWKQALEKSFRHMKGYYFVLLDNSGKNVQAGLPVFHVKSWVTGNRLVSIPFATLCDPLISTSDHMNKLFKPVLELSDEIKCSYMEIRTLSSSSLIQDNQLGSTHFYKHHYLSLENEPEQLKKKFHRTCVRQRISRAIKSELKVRIGENELDLRNFYQLQLITRKRLGLPSQPYKFFKMLWETFAPSKQIQLLLAEKNNKSIAALIIFKFKDRVSAEFAVSDERFRDLSANHFLFWKAIKMAYEEGYKIFDFGRTSSSNESLMDFKRRWGTEVIDLPQFFYPKNKIGKKVINEESWKYEIMSKACKEAPDCLLQIIGNFCYRHLG